MLTQPTLERLRQMRLAGMAGAFLAQLQSSPTCKERPSSVTAHEF